jgi:protease I
MSEKRESVLLLVDDGFEDMELMYPKYRLEEAGYEAVVAGPEAGNLYHGKHGYPCASDVALADVEEKDFVALILPGGWAPDKLRRLPKVKSLVSEFARAAKPVAAICHGGSMAISAGVYEGVRVTGSPGIKDDLVNAGAIYSDEPVVVDRHFVSSRNPDDLPVFVQTLLNLLQKNEKRMHKRIQGKDMR